MLRQKHRKLAINFVRTGGSVRATSGEIRQKAYLAMRVGVDDGTVHHPKACCRKEMSQGMAASGSLRSVSEVEKSKLARLSKACLRVDWSLELENIQQEVLHAAMKLRDASYGVVTLSGATGDLEQLPRHFPGRAAPSILDSFGQLLRQIPRSNQ